MRRRSNPWPSLVDLFSALLVFVFAALLLGGDGGPDGPLAGAVDSIATSVHRAVQGVSNVRRCGLDTCVDLNIEFKLGTDRFASALEDQRVQAACTALKAGLDKLEATERGLIRVAIEGHADKQKGDSLSDIGLVLVNWQVSAQRAARVIYEFSRCGLDAPKYPLLATAFGDTDQLCSDETQACYQRNRRVTLRLQVDSRKLAGDHQE